MSSNWTERLGVPADAARQIEEALAALGDGSPADAGAQECRLLLELCLQRAREAGVNLDWLVAPEGAEALVRLAYAAPFLVRHLTAFPGRLALGVLANLEQPDLPEHAHARSNVPAPAGSTFLALDEAAAMAALRHWKYDRYVRLTARSLLGHDAAPATRTAVTRIAEGVVRAALAYAFAEQARKHGLPVRADGKLAGLAVVGMGKLGGGELNFSSDIDLILVHDGDDAECVGLPPDRRAAAQLPAPGNPGADDADLWARWEALAGTALPPENHAISNGEFFQRVGRQMLRLLSTKTEEGLCFRADADLRPQGKSGLLVPSLAFTARYYEEQGREWERTALVKARRIAGMTRVWNALAEAIRPFVYRRYLDFSAMEGVALIKHDIDRQQTTAHANSVAGRGTEATINLKLGRGGIRECEFLVQAQQLLHGGRMAALQVPGHADAVRALVHERLLEPAEADSLLAEYWTLRGVENRLQMVDEAQTHTLPEDLLARRRVQTDFAPGFGVRQAAAEAALSAARDRVAERYRRLFARLMPKEIEPRGDWRKLLAERLSAAEAEPAREHVDALIARLMRTRAGERCVFKVERLLARPELYAAGTEPALPRWLALMDQIGNRNALFALLEAHPESIAWATRIFTEGGRHAPPLIRHPEFFESFLSQSPPETRSGAAFRRAVRERFGRILAESHDEEEFLLDLQTASAHTRLHILSGYLDIEARRPAEGSAGAAHATGPETAAPPAAYRVMLSDLADAAVDVCARQAWRSLVPRYGLPEGAQEGLAGELTGFAVLALGKLGSREMRFGSDLDLVFVFRGEGTTGKGRTHLEFYTKLAQKLTALVSAPTQFGVLLELDHRLRPFGRKGMLVQSLAAYESFLARGAEVWNFQAFTRARHLCGEPALSQDVLGRIALAWARRRTPPQNVARDVLDMAQRLVAQAPLSAKDRLQLKYALGGMLGYEFLRQCHFLLARQGLVEGEAGALRPADPDAADTLVELPAAEWARLAGSWTPPTERASIARLAPGDLAQLSAGYDVLSALDERASFYVEPFRHEVGPDTFERYSGVGRHWSYGEIRTLCRRMHEGVEAGFRTLGG